MTIVPLSPAVHLSEGATSPHFAIYIFYCETVLGDFFLLFFAFLRFLTEFFFVNDNTKYNEIFFQGPLHC